ncbi:ABC transporter permease [Armatimonas rosea]|uniref:ABC-2 type transport system permease protein n=1 Tax=Armatimonas rosea TaxID=685828 RepID=A0A7W9SQ02_ARMRO|nr:ABC transporter permease [Armatimonas rosea]MBB6050064.1 ABC-2 type transport system permease protein [Armatimonas rosea]
MNTVFRALVANDLRLFFSDKRAMVATICVPILIASFFAMIFGGGGGDSKKAAVAVLVADNDQSAVSQKIIAGLKSEGSFAVTPASEAEARAAVGKGKVSVALVIPAEFGKLSASAVFNPLAPRPKLTFLYDPSHNADLQLARGLMTQQVMQVVSQEAFANPDTSGVSAALQSVEVDTTRSPQERSALVNLLKSVQSYQSTPHTEGTGTERGGMGMSTPCELASEAVVASGTDSPKDASGGKAGATHVFVGMGIQGLLFFAIDLAIGMVRDRRLGLWKRLRAAPLSRLMLLGSRWISSAIIGLVVLAAVLAFGSVLYGIRIHGSLLGFGLLAVASALMVSSFGLLIAALGRTEGQCRAAAVPAVLTMSFLGGAWIPTFMMPAWVQPVSKALPTRWAVDGFDLVTWRGLGLTEALPALGIVTVFALVFAGIALARFRWED